MFYEMGLLKIYGFNCILNVLMIIQGFRVGG